MNKSNPAFTSELEKAIDSLMEAFFEWNSIQEKLKALKRANNHYGPREVQRARNMFQAVAERFLLEDIDYREWRWLETPWTGKDGNTGLEAYIVNFVRANPEGEWWDLLAFYVTRNKRFWLATPLAEVPDPDEGTSVYEANAVQDAIDTLRLER